jgi:hypothetical protein
MSTEKSMGVPGLLLVWAIALLVVTAGFYGLDHLVMNIQGLPINWDLTPGG